MNYFLVAGLLLVAFLLSLVSWLDLCSQLCAEGHHYRLYGFTFEEVGFLFFPLLLITHLFSKRDPRLGILTGWLICAALGAELLFIYVQKYAIGAWCPVCLSIATVLLLAGLIYLFDRKKNEDRRDMRHTLYKNLTGMVFFIAGFFIALGGLGKHHELHAEEMTIKQKIVFGNHHTPIEVYVFTDWACPGCRHLEPALEAMVPKIVQKARLTFVDDPVHDETMNYTPYNLSFMVNNKQSYLALRGALTELSQENKTPTDLQVAALAAKYGVQYEQLNYADVEIATKYFGGLIKKMKVEGTPTLVVYNTQNKKGKKLEGRAEITEEGVLKAIDEVSK